MKKKYNAPEIVVEGMLIAAILAGSEKIECAQPGQEGSHDADAKIFGCDFSDDED